MNSINVLVGQNVKKRRDQLGLSPSEVASAIGKTPAAYLQQEKGESRFSAEDLWLLKRVLRCSVKQFFENCPHSSEKIIAIVRSRD
jgi:transcriptional regulator with XRE-family HTH domain